MFNKKRKINFTQSVKVQNNELKIFIHQLGMLSQKVDLITVELKQLTLKINELIKPKVDNTLSYNYYA